MYALVAKKATEVYGSGYAAEWILSGLWGVDRLVNEEDPIFSISDLRTYFAS